MKEDKGVELQAGRYTPNCDCVCRSVGWGCVCMCVCAHVCAGQRTTLGVSRYFLTTLTIEAESLVGLELTMQARPAARKPRCPPASTHPSSGAHVCATRPGLFDVGDGILYSGTHVCPVGTLQAESFPQSL